MEYLKVIQKKKRGGRVNTTFFYPGKRVKSEILKIISIICRIYSKYNNEVQPKYTQSVPKTFSTTSPGGKSGPTFH